MSLLVTAHGTLPRLPRNIMRAVDHDRIPERPLVGNLDATSLSRPRQIRADTRQLISQFFLILIVVW